MTQQASTSGPLAGLRVVEMGSLIAGPFLITWTMAIA